MKKLNIEKVFSADILSDEEKIIVHEFYGFDGNEKSLDEIKKIVKCSKTDVEKKLRSAITKLKSYVKEKEKEN